MDYNEININSSDFNVLSNFEKLKVVKSKLNNMFDYRGKKSVTVIYKGSKKEINRDNFGIYKNLVEREKALEKKVKTSNVSSDSPEVIVSDDVKYVNNYNEVDIDINSNEFKMMPDSEKLKVIKKKLDNMFNYTGNKAITVVYNGNKKQISKDNFGIYKNLVEREKALEKRVKPIPLYTVFISSDEYKCMSLDEKIAVLESKLNYFFEARKKDRYKNEQLISVIYKGTTKFVPISLCEQTDTVIQLIENLKKQMKDSNGKVDISKSEPEIIENDSDIEINFTYVPCEEEKYYNHNKEIIVDLEFLSDKEKYTSLAVRGTTAVRKNENKKRSFGKIVETSFGYIDKMFLGIENGVGNLFRTVSDKFKKIKNTTVKTSNNEVINEHKIKSNSFTKARLKLDNLTTKFSVSYNVKKIMANEVKKEKNKDKSKKKIFIKTLAVLTGGWAFIKKCGIMMSNKVKSGVNKAKKFLARKKEETSSPEFANKARIVKKRAAALVCSFALFGSLLVIKSHDKNGSNDESLSNNNTTQTNNDLNKDNNFIPETTNDTTFNDELNILPDVTIPDNVDEEISNDKTDINEDETIDDKTDINEDETIDDKTDNQDEINIDTEKEDNLSFDDIVTIDDNAYIYTNCYDATYSNNALNPYYDGEYERNIEGLVYELNGSIYVIYDYDSDALEKQKELEEQGAMITAVLVARTDYASENTYEGYYNVNNVKVKTR